MGQVKLRQAEREFYYRQLGANYPLVPINQLSKNFYLHYLGANVANNQVPIEQLENMFLKQWILAHGGTPPNETGGHPVGWKYDLWRQALVQSGYGGSIPHRVTAIQLIFYLNN